MKTHDDSAAAGVPEQCAIPDPDGRWAYGVDEFAEKWGVGRTFVFELIRRRKLRAIKLGRRTLIPATECARLAKGEAA